MSFLDKLKSLFTGGSSTGAGGVQHTLEPDAARADDTHDTHEPVAPPMPPADPAGMPTGEPQPAEPQAGGTAETPGTDRSAS
jgi:hypothetical protein